MVLSCSNRSSLARSATSASATVAASEAPRTRVHHSTGRVFVELQQFLDLRLGSASISPRISSLVSSCSSESASAASSGAISSTMSAAFSGSSDSRSPPASWVRFPKARRPPLRCLWFRRSLRARPGLVPRRCRQVRRVQFFEPVITDGEPQAPQRIGFHHIAKFPTDGVRRDGFLQPPDPAPGMPPAADGGPRCAAPRPLPPRAAWRARPPGESPW